MTEEQKDNPTDNPSDTIIPPVSTTEYVVETTANIPEPIPPNSKTENINKEPVQVIVNIPKEENKTAVTANRIAIVGTVINLALAGMTYLLFQKTIEANKTSQFSLVEAQKAVDQAKRANDIAEANFKLAQISSASSDSVNSVTLDLTKKSVNTQVSSIQQAQKVFELESRPLIQLADIKIDSIGIDKETVISYNILNMGKFPATITFEKTNLSVGTTEFYIPEFTKKIETLNLEMINTPISKETKVGQIMRGRPLSQSEFSNYSAGKSFVYLIGEIRYVSFGTNNAYSTIFVYKLNQIKDNMNAVGLKIEDKILH